MNWIQRSTTEEEIGGMAWRMMELSLGTVLHVVCELAALSDESWIAMTMNWSSLRMGSSENNRFRWMFELNFVIVMDGDRASWTSESEPSVRGEPVRMLSEKKSHFSFEPNMPRAEAQEKSKINEIVFHYISYDENNERQRATNLTPVPISSQSSIWKN